MTDGAVTVALSSDKGTISVTEYTNNTYATVKTVHGQNVPLVLRKNPDVDPATTTAQGTTGAKFGTIVGNPQASNENTRITLTLAAGDVDDASDPIVVTASALNYDSSMRTIPVTDRDALDTQGYRVVIANKTHGQWLNIGNNKVNVELKRVGNVAYPWSDFGSIKVSLRDTAHDNTATPYEIDYVTAAGFNNEDGTITFREVFKPHATRSDGIVANEGNVVYLGNDVIRFQVGVNARGSDRPAETEPTDGQYLGVYAHVEFRSGSLTREITNMQSDDPVYPSNPTLVDEANRYIGDGKLVKVDNLAPSPDVITAVNVSDGGWQATYWC